MVYSTTSISSPEKGSSQSSADLITVLPLPMSFRLSTGVLFIPYWITWEANQIEYRLASIAHRTRHRPIGSAHATSSVQACFRGRCRDLVGASPFEVAGQGFRLVSAATVYASKQAESVVAGDDATMQG
jgi:hypothetical protein